MEDRFSPAWVERLDRALRAAPVDDGAAVIVEHTVEDRAHDHVWHVRVGDGTARAVPGPAPADVGGVPVVRLRSDVATAAALAEGRDAGRVAFMRGDLQVGGDTTALVAARDVLEALARAGAPGEAAEGPGHDGG